MTVSKFSTNINELGTNAIWHVGEYLEPQDRRILLLWTSSDIRNAFQKLLPNWIDHDYKVLGYPNSQLNRPNNVLENLRKIEIEILQNVLQQGRRESFTNNENESFDRLSILSSSPPIFRKIVDAMMDPNPVEGDELLNSIETDPQTPNYLAVEIDRHLRGDFRFKKTESLDFFLSALLTFIPISCAATMIFIFRKSLTFDDQLTQLSKDGGIDKIFHRYPNIPCRSPYFGDICNSQSKKIWNSSVDYRKYTIAALAGTFLSVNYFKKFPISEYINATSSNKYPIKRKEWKYSRAIIAGSLISLYTYARNQQKPATSLSTTLFRSFFDTLVFIGTIAETKLLLS